jgi:hypothetical protein
MATSSTSTLVHLIKPVYMKWSSSQTLQGKPCVKFLVILNFLMVRS